MAKRGRQPELTFQQHVADYLVRVHGYCQLEQAEITDTERFLCATINGANEVLNIAWSRSG